MEQLRKKKEEEEEDGEEEQESNSQQARFTCKGKDIGLQIFTSQDRGWPTGNFTVSDLLQDTDNKLFKWTFEDRSISEDEVILMIKKLHNRSERMLESQWKSHIQKGQMWTCKHMFTNKN